MKIENIVIKIENVQNENKMNYQSLNQKTVFQKENKDKNNNSFINIFNTIANKKDE